MVRCSIPSARSFRTEKRSTPASPFILIDTDITINEAPFAMAFWLENEQLCAVYFGSQAISSNEFLFHSHVRAKGNKQEAENAHQNKIVPLECQKLSSQAIKSSENQRTIVFRFDANTNACSAYETNSIFVLCACVWMWEYFCFASAHQRFSFSFYVIWFPIDNQRVIGTHIELNVQIHSSHTKQKWGNFHFYL